MSGIFIKNEKGNFECPSKFIVKDIVRWGPWHGTHTFCGTVWELLLAGFCCMLMLGCGSSGVVSPEVAKRAEEMSSPFAKELATHLAAQKLTGEMTLENTQAIMAKLNTLEASLSVPEPNGEEVIKSAPESPAKANDTPNPLKVATPGTSSRVASDGTRLKWDVQGNWNPTILETSAHLTSDHGINTNGMTHQEMADIHASIHDGKQIPVSAVRVKNAGAVSNCPGGMCPTNRTQRRRGLFGGLFR